MVISDADNLVAALEAPTAKTIERQRQQQLEAVMNIRRMLQQVSSLSERRKSA